MKTQIKAKKILRKALMLMVLFLLLSVNLSLAQQSGWFVLNTGFDTNYAWDWTTFINSNTGFAVGSIKIGFIYYPRIIKTTNGGSNWYQISTLMKDSADFIFRNITFTNASTGFITTAGINVNPSVRGKILKTTNGGENWYNIPLPVDRHMTMLFFINASTGYATGHQVILKTTDAGENWAISNWGTGYLFAIHFTDVNTGFVAGNFGTIYKTINGGNNWTMSQPTTIHLWGLCFKDASTGFAVGYQDVNTTIILKTTNAGNNWDTVCRPPNSYGGGWSVRFISPDIGYIAGVVGVSRTVNGGLNWTDQILPIPPNVAIRNSYFVNANTGYLSALHMNRDFGLILKTTNGGVPTGIKPVSNEVPTEFKLEQNYPNPFNQSTMFKFQCSMAGVVQLKVFDLLGREVAVLVNEKLQAGTYEISFDARLGGSSTDLPSGVYFYRLTAGEFTDTKKLVLMK